MTEKAYDPFAEEFIDADIDNDAQLNVPPFEVAEAEEPEAPTPEPVPAPEPPATPTEEDIEEREDLEGGGSYVIRKVNKGAGRKYQAQVTPIEGNVQFYYNDTKQGLLREVLKAQVHATTKIHQQERRWKTSAQPVVKTGRNLTSEERIHANELFQTDAVAAQEYIQEILTGQTKADRAATAQAQKEATEKAEAEKALEIYRRAALEFFTARPAYDPTENNRFVLVNFMCEKFFGQGIARTAESMLDGENKLLYHGFITSQNFCQAYDVLNAKGFLDLKAPTPTAAPAATATVRIDPPAKPQTPAIVAPAPVIRRPRVTGLKANQGSVEPENSPTPTPADELDKLDMLSDEELRELTYGKNGFVARMARGE
jgi:hypothetical protein